MKSERWKQIEELFQSALERPARERSAFLAEVCGGDESLRREVESLVASYERDEGFIEAPAFEIAAPLFADAPLVGQSVSHYKILSLVGVGGMGEVYEAEDTRLGRKVALKLLPAYFVSDESRLRRFEQEARAASALNHPNILTIHEIGEVDGRRFITMEFIEGETLRQRMGREVIKVAEALNIAEQVASALGAAHSHGIIHRDIKPENIMIRKDGYVKVLDFGLVKLTKRWAGDAGAPVPELGNFATIPGMLMGTAPYMSPEQARGLAADERADVWSLGVVLYEMLAGRAPFEGPTASDVIAAVLEREPPPLSGQPPEVPQALECIIRKALTKDRDERYRTAQEMLTELRRIKQKLQFAVELEDSIRTEDESGAQASLQSGSGVRQGRDSVSKIAGSRVPTPAARSEPSAKYLAGKIKRHKRIITLAMLAGVTGAAFGLYKIFGHKEAVTAPQAPPATQTTGAPRIAQITTSAGLDRDPSFSPDGSYIAYSSNRNGNFEIYVKSLIPGGREIQITEDGDQNFQPTWSSDGRLIAYHSKNRGGIWIIPGLGGLARQVTEFGSNPAWSPDGSLIVSLRCLPTSRPLPSGSSRRKVAPQNRSRGRKPTSPDTSRQAADMFPPHGRPMESASHFTPLDYLVRFGPSL